MVFSYIQPKHFETSFCCNFRWYSILCGLTCRHLWWVYALLFVQDFYVLVKQLRFELILIELKFTYNRCMIIFLWTSSPPEVATNWSWFLHSEYLWLPRFKMTELKNIGFFCLHMYRHKQMKCRGINLGGGGGGYKNTPSFSKRLQPKKNSNGNWAFTFQHHLACLFNPVFFPFYRKNYGS